jgi:hypothetical protein
VIDRERLRQTILDEMGGNLNACFESAIDYYIATEARLDELEAENAVLRRGFSFGAARVGDRALKRKLPPKPVVPPLDVADPIREASPNA